VFKWVAIFAIDALPINPLMSEVFKNVDLAIATTKRGQEAISNMGLECLHFPYGPNEVFCDLGKREDEDKIKIIHCAKNSQGSNTGGLLMGLNELKKRTDTPLDAYFHINPSSPGDYNIKLLIDRFGLKDSIAFPKKFVSLNDGITDSEMNELYNQYDFVVDTSVRSSTGMTILEGMAAGCIPIMPDIGAFSEILEKLPHRYRFSIYGVPYIGELEEEYCVILPKNLADTLHQAYFEFLRNMTKEEKVEMRGIYQETARNYAGKNDAQEKETFAKKIIDQVKEIDINGRTLQLDTI